MNKSSLNKYLININIVKYKYFHSDYFTRRQMKRKLYGSKKVSSFIKDIIWEYLNEPIGSPYFVNYNELLKRCKFYEDNVRFHTADDK